jgi:hypothetical protein
LIKQHSFLLQQQTNHAIHNHQQRRTAMSDLSMSQFVNKDDLEDARQEALIASRIKAAAVVTRLQQAGAHWTFTAKPEKSK